MRLRNVVLLFSLVDTVPFSPFPLANSREPLSQTSSSDEDDGKVEFITEFGLEEDDDNSSAKSEKGGQEDWGKVDEWGRLRREKEEQSEERSREDARGREKRRDNPERAYGVESLERFSKGSRESSFR
ncbi:hypothetical protein BDK51DRAFT_52476 [Blyttiomyces helicus]|uniref:Uncharacterized protein n=1 Tax=Blyttiomyces helicus TaxID=388810 RepID=A0A4V1IQ37_9FUNG|nr:hypothetical protein BDK51DRAFT_52476 [Blyttiomyces helicus]|eukprot:RKO85197.1 hypothetical protein BDK51DRAFT_52476 [Blyttiomyces helicus]